MKADTVSNYITFATGRSTNKDLNYRLRMNTDARIPKLKITYKSADIVAYANTATTENIGEVIENLGKSGVLDLSSTAYKGYTTLREVSKKEVNSAMYEEISDGTAFANIDELLKAYDDAVVKAQNEALNHPDIYINFNDETASNQISGSKYSAELKGEPVFITGPDGSKALKISNTFGPEAQQYLDLGKYSIGENSFSVVFWMQAVNGGMDSPATSSSEMGTGAIDFSSIATTVPKGGVVLSNKDFSTNANTGFALTAMPYNAHFGVNLKVGDNSVSNSNGYQTVLEGRWHQIAMVVDRSGKAVVYRDNTALTTIDISSMTGTLDGTDSEGNIINLVLGADGLGQYGMMNGAFDEIRVYPVALTAGKIEELYYINALNKLNNDVESFLDSKDTALYLDADITSLQTQLAASKTYADSYELGNTSVLKTNYTQTESVYNNVRNTNALGTAIFTSDAHISGSSHTHSRAVKLINAMTEYKDLGFDVDTFVLSGDVSETGGKHLPYFFDIFDAYWGAEEGKNTVVIRGNHDEPACSDTGETRTQLLNEFKTWVAKHVDVTLEPNVSLSTDGVLDSPYYYAKDENAHYIGLDNYASKSSTATVNTISSEQLTWLDNTLASINGDGKPIFVIQHDPMASLASDTQRTNLQNVLDKYDNVFLICGHTHYGFGTGDERTLRKYGNTYQINLPALKGDNISRGYPYGTGFYAHIYDDKVVFRARDFENQIWMPDYDLTFDLKPASNNKQTVMGTMVISDDTTTYETVAEAAGKTVKVIVPVTVAEENANYSAIVAAYNGTSLTYADTDTVSASGQIEFELIVPADTTGIKVMLWDKLSNMIPKCDAVSK